MVAPGSALQASHCIGGPAHHALPEAGLLRKLTNRLAKDAILSMSLVLLDHLFDRGWQML
ncbi:hypothetical protein C2E25_15590 [Geothermobacter hydrogeniphilus]|uniref:Uncharacterized protein n=1 Tax=Geothermobacter hydrogeniphilus TaxID=1969733 RepID=A0A2K2H6I7_9BACT|nr:hypothetical protein C2E25_15590 [Geothermobacter hydrogeniphilus]